MYHCTHQLAGYEDKFCQTILCSFLPWRNEMDTMVPLVPGEAAVACFQPIQGQDSVTSCLLGASETAESFHQWLHFTWQRFHSHQLRLYRACEFPQDASLRNIRKDFAPRYSSLLVASVSELCFDWCQCPSTSSCPLEQRCADQGTGTLPLRSGSMAMLAFPGARDVTSWHLSFCHPNCLSYQLALCSGISLLSHTVVLVCSLI